jgi:hypothetical protein
MEEKKTIFRQESIDRMQSPEKIDEYIRVSTPRAWILAAALALIVVGVLVWGFVGSIPKTISASGVVMDEYDGVVCLLPVGTAGQYLVGHESHVTLPDGSGISGKVVLVSKDPLSYEEASDRMRSDWRVQSIWGDSDDMYKYGVVTDCGTTELPDRELVTVSVVLSDVRPITYILN